MAYSEATVAWAELWSSCWICGHRGEWPQTLQIHHLVRGCNRKANDLATTALACEACHQREHDGAGLGLVGWMAIKMLHDPEHYDRERVNELRHRAKNAVSEKEVAIVVAALFQRARR